MKLKLEMKRVASTLTISVLLVLSFFQAIYAQPRPIGQTVQENPFDSNPTAHTEKGVLVTSPTSAYDGSLTTMADFEYGYYGYFELSAFNSTPPTSFAISWVDMKISYKAEGVFFSDDLYRILCYVDPYPDPIVLQDWVTGEDALYDPGTSGQGHRAWGNVTEPNDGVWDWTDVGNVHIVIETDDGANGFSDFVYMYVYEVWLTIYSGPLPPVGVSVQPSPVLDVPAGEIFFVDVYIRAVTKLWGYQFVLYFDNTTVRARKYYSYGPFNSPGPSGIGPDYVAVAYSSYFGDPEGLTGSGPLARIYFEVLTDGVSLLDLEGVVCVDVKGDAILVDVTDGFFANVYVPPTRALILFDQTHGTDPISQYSTWINNLHANNYTIDTWTAGSITPSVLDQYDIFVIPQALDYYSSDELSAIKDFVLNGGGLLVIGDDYPSIYADLTGFAGIDWMSGGVSGITYDITPHEVTEGVNSVYLDAPIAEMLVAAPALDLVRDPSGGIMLAVSEQVGRVIGFADEGSLWDYGIVQEDNLRLANNMIDWLGVKYEHELVVSLDAPSSLEPGGSSLLNATVYNIGLNNETDVELQLLINGTMANSTVISLLQVDYKYTLSYLWTPTVEGIYNVTAYAPPVPDENITSNNWKSEFVGVIEIVKAVVLDSLGTDYGYYAFWDYLNTNWATYGSIPVVIDYTSLNKEDITLADIEATHADVLIISDAWSDTYDYGWEFSDSEIEAIKTYVLSGHGIIATSGTFDTWSAPNNQKLAELFGMDPTIWYNWGFNGEEKSTSGTFELQTPRHNELWYNISNPYLSGFLVTLNPTPSSDWAVQGVTTGWIEALSTDHYAAVITSEVYRAVYFTCMLEFEGQYNENNRQLFYNAIVWTQLPPYEHELAVSLGAPKFLEPGDSSLLNATVYNLGLSNETNVELQLLINGSVVDSVVISELVSRSSYTLSYLWTPRVEATYNVTAYAPPVEGESVTTNNVFSAFVTVRFTPRILAYVQYTDYYQEYAHSLAAIHSTFGPTYVLTELWDYTQLDSTLPGNDVLFIPEQEYSYLSMMETIGEAWSETLSDFLEEGGVIILCDFNWGDGGTYGILTGAGLMSISSVNYITGWTVYLVDPTDPLASGVSSSFTAPDGALSFVTDEPDIVFDDGTYPVVIHKKVGQGHIALIGFDYFASNPDADQILGNAVSLALYMTISISPPAGSPGTEVTVTGIKASANGAVEIYWDDAFIGDATADAAGNFTYLLTVPLNATAGLHEIRTVDVATGETSSRTFRVIFITINPISGPIGTKATVNGAGFSAYTQVLITFNDMQIGYAMTDDIGNFTFVFNIPLSEAGLHLVKGWYGSTYVDATFTVVDVLPLDITLDVGSIFFKGETAEFYVQTSFRGVPVDVASIHVTLYKPDGTAETLTAQRIATGLYKIEYPVKGKGSMLGTHTLVVEASYNTSAVNAHGTTIKTFLVKSTWEREAPKIAAFSIASIVLVSAMLLLWRREEKKYL